MILTGPLIRELATTTRTPGGRIVIDPFDPACVGPASYDLHLGDELRWYDTDEWHGTISAHHAIDPKNPPPARLCPWSAGPYGAHMTLRPGRVYLACTREYTETHGLAAQVAGRSSWGRYGLFVHVTAGFIDPGFCGRITLELVATQPVIVRPGDRIGQIIYSTIMGEYQPYRGRYAGDMGPTASRFHLPTPTVSNMGEGE
jgi:dCTP deaminase